MEVTAVNGCKGPYTLQLLGKHADIDSRQLGTNFFDTRTRADFLADSRSVSYSLLYATVYSVKRMQF